MCRHLTRAGSQWYYLVDRGIQCKIDDNRWRWWTTKDAGHDVSQEARKVDNARAFVPRLLSLPQLCVSFVNSTCSVMIPRVVCKRCRHERYGKNRWLKTADPALGRCFARVLDTAAPDTPRI